MIRKVISFPALGIFLSMGFLSWGNAATTLVNWGGGINEQLKEFEGTVVVETGLDLGGGPATDSRFGLPFVGGPSGLPATNTPMSPVMPTYTGQSETFYGGYSVTRFDTDTPALLNPNSAGLSSQSGGTIAFEVQSVANQQHRFTFLPLWDKTNFLNGGDSNPVAMDITSGITFSLRSAQCTNCQPEVHLHFVVRDGSQYYVSQAFWGGTDPTELGYQGSFPDGEVVTYTALPGSFWQAYNPSGLDMAFSHGPYTQPTFSNITGVGFFVDTLSLLGGGPAQNNNQIFVQSFSVSGFVVPEPSRAVLAMVGLGACLMVRRRRIG
jgi:hypothetical protein